MRNREYWKRRFIILEEMRNKQANIFTAEIERQFRLAQKELDEKIEQWYGRFAENNQISLADAKVWLQGKDLAEFKWDVNEYIKRGKENALTGEWIKELENASARVHITKYESLKIKTQNVLETLYGQTENKVGGFLTQVFEDSYNRTAFELQKGFNVGFPLASVNKDIVKSVLSKPWTLDGDTFSDRLWAHKQSLVNEVHTQLSQNMLLGRSPKEAINAISSKFNASKYNASKYNAGRLVMTESAFFASDAQKECFNNLTVERYEIVATLDARTSEICQTLDGTVEDMKNYHVGVTAPPFHPWCRTVTVPYFDDNSGERFARNADGEPTHVPSDMNYSAWKEKFINNDKKTLQFRENSGIINTDNKTKKGDDEYVSSNKNNSKIRNNAGTEKAGLEESLNTGTSGAVTERVGSVFTSVGRGNSKNSGGDSSAGSGESGINKSFSRFGIDNLEKTSPADYSERMETVSKQNADSGKVDMHTPSEWEESGAKLFSGAGKNRDGEQSYYGAAVKPDGDIVGVFSGVPGKSRDAMINAISNGGNKLDAYAVDDDTGEPGKLAYIYHKSGFEPVARVKFNPDYVDPADIGGEQDIVFYIHNGDSAEYVAENYGKYPMPTKEQYDSLPIMEYDEALKYRDDLLEKRQNNNNINKHNATK